MASRRKSIAGERFRRSPALALSWADDGLVALDCRTARRSIVPTDLVPYLDRLSRWTTAEQLRAAHPEVGRLEDVSRLLTVMHDLGLLEREVDRLQWEWSQWPEAAAFHFGTRGGQYPRDPLAHDRTLRAKARRQPPPPPTKSVSGAATTLGPAQSLGDLTAALLERRTWRRFGRAPLAVEDLASLLRLTWGVQKRGLVKGQGPVVLKTSPSGGCRHPIEAYVVASRVRGLKAGVYHYDAAGHRLVDLKKPVSRRLVQTLVGHQYYFADCAALVVMAAVFRRTMWRYPSSRAYRAILIESGHLGQTFCVLATRLGLAPFGTIAFQDDHVDRLIGVDGINEGSIYIVGVGSRPAGAIERPGRIASRRGRDANYQG